MGELEMSPSCKVLRQRSRAGRLVVAPVRRSVKIFLHLARCNGLFPGCGGGVECLPWNLQTSRSLTLRV
jgi:hypothetical protein